MEKAGYKECVDVLAVLETAQMRMPCRRSWRCMSTPFISTKTVWDRNAV